MCDFCNRKVETSLLLKLKREGKSATNDMCPTCAARISEHSLSASVENPLRVVLFVNDFWIPEGLFPDGVPEGPIDYTPHPEKYTVFDGKVQYKHLSIDQLIRLMGHSLLPDEYQDMIEAGHSANEYLLCDEFYDEDGVAYEPVSDDYYRAALKARIDQGKAEVDELHKKQDKAINKIYMARHALRMIRKEKNR